MKVDYFKYSKASVQSNREYDGEVKKGIQGAWNEWRRVT